MNYEEHPSYIYHEEHIHQQQQAELVASYDIGIEHYNETIHTGVLPKYVRINGVTHRRTVGTGDELTYKEFLALPSGRQSRRNVGQDARNYLFALLHGRLGVSDTRGRLPLLSAEEALDAIGVDRPTPAQINFATGVLQTLFGEPKHFDGKDRWRVTLSFDDQTLPPWLHDLFPLPPFDWSPQRSH